MSIAEKELHRADSAADVVNVNAGDAGIGRLIA